MFKEQTLFILGAGASYPYGYPLGKPLIKGIINNIDSDQVYASQRDSIQLAEYQKQLLNLNVDFFGYKSSKHIDIANNTSYLAIKYPSPFGLEFLPTKLNNFKEFEELKKALIDFDPISIDAFLRDNPKYANAGKIMIVYTLLKCEDVNAFSLNSADKKVPLDGNPRQYDNWYSHLINDMLTGCTEPNDIFNNKIDIVTFNYDLSLEYYLFDKLKKIEFLNKTSTASDYIEKLKQGIIKHVYGSLYKPDDIADYGSFQADKNTDIAMKNTKCLLKALRNYEEIKTIPEERAMETETAYFRELIKNSKEIIIIGFGFDRNNLSVLSFPNNIGYYGRFNGKTIKYLDYEGRMNSLYDQFQKIQSHFNTSPQNQLTVIRSKSTSIIDAYQNDFKIYLFQ